MKKNLLKISAKSVFELRHLIKPYSDQSLFQTLVNGISRREPVDKYLEEHFGHRSILNNVKSNFFHQLIVTISLIPLPACIARFSPF